MKVLNRKIILASKSPRRSQLLEEAGFTFEIKTKEVDESYPPNLPVLEVAKYIAQKKAIACMDFLNNDGILLAADSIVALGNSIFGKPKDKADAISILQQLSGKTHQVITGVCLKSLQKESLFAGVSNVTFDPLSLAEIEYYIDNFQPYDKAGAYGIQEWIGHCKITKIEGTYTNIVGLPVQLVYEELSKF